MQGCSAPFCAVDNTGVVFELYKFPADRDLCNTWQASIALSSAAGRKWDSNMHLCEVHFDERSWANDCGQRRLKDSAIPSIFQHVTPTEYMEVAYKKFKSASIDSDLLQSGMSTIEKLRSESNLDDDDVRKELIEFSNLVVVSVLQELRINQKSKIISSTKRENENLREVVSDFSIKLKEVVGTAKRTD